MSFYRFRGELNQIDHILPSFSLRKSGSSIKTRVVEVSEQANPRISDHRPLVVTIELP
jgi:endonuclease/exonuclease/phosphatase family metal-dependent hydrolase